ncbi:hypothetical protein [Desulfitobacterium hafniense]|uniref:hypothetical protein n=1 Tax=Desulfitobacterium hafniense TaxID=49338 RepID=UPI0003638B86|nr:hypothetical protein [Desulfitobacterium hafniense]
MSETPYQEYKSLSDSATLSYRNQAGDVGTFTYEFLKISLFQGPAFQIKEKIT